MATLGLTLATIKDFPNMASGDQCLLASLLVFVLVPLQLGIVVSVQRNLLSRQIDAINCLFKGLEIFFQPSRQVIGGRNTCGTYRAVSRLSGIALAFISAGSYLCWDEQNGKTLQGINPSDVQRKLIDKKARNSSQSTSSELLRGTLTSSPKSCP